MAETSIMVRVLTDQDAEAFLAWRGEDDYTEEICRQHLVEQLWGERVILVAVQGALLVGTLQVVFDQEDEDLANGSDVAYLEALEVRPEYRRQRIASRMVEAAEALARERGFRRLTVMVEPGNVPSLGVFQRLGYQVFKKSDYVWRDCIAPTVCLAKALA